MAGLPGWLVDESTDPQNIVIRVRLWHPSYLGDLWRGIAVRPAWGKPGVVLWIWARTLWVTYAPAAWRKEG